MGKKIETKYVLSGSDRTKGAMRSMQKNTKKTTKTVNGLKKSLGGLLKLVGPLAALGSVAGIAKLGTDAINSADHINKLSQRLGASTEALSQYKFAADQSGIAFTTLTMGWQRMVRRVNEASHGFGEAKGALKELNLEAKALTKLAPEDQFEAIGEAISRVESPADKVRLAMKLFDSEGVSLIQMFKEGSSGMREYRDEADKLGATLSKEMADGASETKDAVNRLSTAWGGLSNTLGIIVMPAIKSVTDSAIGLTGALIDMRKDMENTAFINNISDALMTAAEHGDLFRKSMSRAVGPFGKRVRTFVVFDKKQVEAETQKVINAMEKLEGSGFIRAGLILGEDFIEGLKMGLSTEQAIIFEQQQQDFKKQMEELNKIIGQGIVSAPVIPKDFTAAALEAPIPENMLMDVPLGIGLTQEEWLLQIGFSQQWIDSLSGIATATSNTEVANRALANSFVNLASGGVDILADSVSQLVEAWISAERPMIMFGRALKRMVASIIGDLVRMIAKAMIANLLLSALGLNGTGLTGIKKILQGSLMSMGGLEERAAGGPTQAGTTYLVGEEGPELFRANMAGNITPNNELGMGGSTSISIHVDEINTDDPIKIRQFAEKLNEEIEMIKKGYYINTVAV